MPEIAYTIIRPPRVAQIPFPNLGQAGGVVGAWRTGATLHLQAATSLTGTSV